MSADDNANANARASIREHLRVFENEGRCDGPCDCIGQEVFKPPVEVTCDSFSGLWGRKGFIAPTVSMHSSPVRYTRPAGMSEEVCSNLPYSFWT